MEYRWQLRNHSEAKYLVVDRLDEAPQKEEQEEEEQLPSLDMF